MSELIFEEGIKEALVGVVLATKTYAKATPSPYCTTNELALLLVKEVVMSVKMHEGELDMMFAKLVTEHRLRLEWLASHSWEAKIKEVLASIVRRLLRAELGGFSERA